MDVLQWFWDVGSWLILPGLGLGMMVFAFTEKPLADSPILERGQRPAVLIFAIALGDAVAGDSRSGVERVCKGVTVVMVMASLAVAWWRRRRVRLALSD